MTDQLKACPFCGGQATIIEAEDVDGRFAAVGCAKCGCGSRQHYFLGDDARQQVTSAWNTRAQAEDGDAVAWRVVADAAICDLLNDDERDVLYFDKSDVPTGDEALGFTITPLYTHPPCSNGDSHD